MRATSIFLLMIVLCLKISAQSSVDSLAAVAITGIYEGNYGSEKYLERDYHNISIKQIGYNQVAIYGELLDTIKASVFKDADNEIHLTTSHPTVRLKYLAEYQKINVRIDKPDGTVFRFIGSKTNPNKKITKPEIKTGPTKTELIGTYAGIFNSPNSTTGIIDTIDVYTNDEIESDKTDNRLVIKYGIRLVPRGYFTKDMIVRIQKYFQNHNIEDLDNKVIDLKIFEDRTKIYIRNNQYGWVFEGNRLSTKI